VTLSLKGSRRLGPSALPSLVSLVHRMLLSWSQQAALSTEIPPSYNPRYHARARDYRVRQFRMSGRGHMAPPLPIPPYKPRGDRVTARFRTRELFGAAPPRRIT
jgi:hypothetical protein